MKETGQNSKKILIRGAGDLATGVALVLHAAGLRVAMTEIAAPLVVRCSVSFADAIYKGKNTVEGVDAFACTAQDLEKIWEKHAIPVVVDPNMEQLGHLSWDALVDGRMLKKDLGDIKGETPLIGLGPGFTVGVNCHAAIETNRGIHLGKVFLNGSPQADTGIPGIVEGFARERVLYSSTSGVFEPLVEIGEIVEAGQILARSGGEEIRAPFKGLLRGILRPQAYLEAHVKVGDVDPRLDPELARHPSDKAMAVGHGVLEALRSLQVI